MAKRPTKRENGEGYVELTKSGNYACTITSKYIDTNTLKYKKIKHTMPTEKEEPSFHAGSNQRKFE